MANVRDAWEAGVDAIIADPTINRGAFVDAMQTIITQGLSNAEGNAYVDAVAAVYESIGLINNATFNNLRNEINTEGKPTSMAAFDALEPAINLDAAALPVNNAARLMELRDERDNADAAITRLDDLIAAEPAGVVGRFVKDVLRNGRRDVRQHKQAVRDEIRNLTGDPDG